MLLFALLTVVCIGCDRVTKEVAATHLRGAEPVQCAGGVVTLEYAENRGAFLGLGDELPAPARFWALGVGTSLLLAGVAFSLWRGRGLRLSAWIALVLILAGGASNLVDRILHGYVVDFLVLRLGVLHTGVFNVADVAITAGGLGLVFAAMGRRGRAGTERRPRAPQ